MTDRNLSIIGVPTNSAGKKDGVARAPKALRRAGLAETLERTCNVRDRGDVIFSAPTTQRDSCSGVIAPGSLASMALGVRSAVSQAFQEGRFPLVIGGDCPVLLGCLMACKEQGGRTGLLFVDGHEDAYPAHQSPTGESADMELGFALGLEVPEQVQKAIGPAPLIRASEVCIMGARDKGVLLKAGVRSLDGSVEMYSDSDLKNGIESLTKKAVDKLSRNTDRLWLHVDLDVLSTESLPAVDYQQPGGINWQQLEALAKTALSSGKIAGCNVTIYNPDMDPDGRSARRIVEFLENALSQ
jgi:arginase